MGKGERWTETEKGETERQMRETEERELFHKNVSLFPFVSCFPLHFKTRIRLCLVNPRL